MSDTSAAPHPASTGGEIRSLNTLRGIAALMVAVYHAPLLFGMDKTLPHAYLAVDMFFALSGFVLLHAYEARIESGLSLARFMQLRLARLYPLLVIATVLGFALWGLKAMTGHTPMTWKAFAALPLNLSLLPALFEVTPNQSAYPFVTQSWSILWEVALGLALFLAPKPLRDRAWMLALLGAGVLVVVAIRQGNLDGGWSIPTFFTGPLRAFSAFWAGVTVRQLTRRHTIDWRIGLAAIISAVAAFIYMAIVSRTIAWMDFACAVFAFPLIIAAASQARHWLVANPVGDVLGEASYSVYLLQGVSIDVAVMVVRHVNGSPLVHLLIGLGWTVAMVVFSWASWKWVETPLRVYFSRQDSRLSQRIRGLRLADSPTKRTLAG